MFWKSKKGEGLLYEDIFRKLQEKKVRYLVIGGVAVNLFNIQRATGDIDLMLFMDKDNIHNFNKVMKELGLKPKVPVNPDDLGDPEKIKKWQDEKNMKVFSFIHPDNPYILVDIMTSNPIDFEEAYKKREKRTAWGTEVLVISKEDLIKLKEIANRPQDLADIEALKTLWENK